MVSTSKFVFNLLLCG